MIIYLCSGHIVSYNHSFCSPDFIILLRNNKFHHINKQEGGKPEAEAATEETKKSNHVLRKIEKRQQGRSLDAHIEEQFGGGRLLACISSRPGQCGRADG